MCSWLLSFPALETRRNALSPQPDPLRQGLRFTFGSLEHDVGHRFHVRHSHFTSTQPTDEIQYGWPGGRPGIHGRTKFGGNDTAKIGRTEREITVDDADCFEAFQTLRDFRPGEGPEPAQPHESDF